MPRYHVMFIVDGLCILLCVNCLLRGYRTLAFSLAFVGLLFEFIVKAMPFMRQLSGECRHLIGEFVPNASSGHAPGLHHQPSSVTRTSLANYESRTLHLTNCSDLLVSAQ